MLSVSRETALQSLLVSQGVFARISEIASVGCVLCIAGGTAEMSPVSRLTQCSAAGGSSLRLGPCTQVGGQHALQPGLWAPPPQHPPQRQQEVYVDTSQPASPI